jgi:toxin YoeB
MRLVFTESAWQDYLWFQDRDRKLLKRINSLIRDILRSPYDGIGKPEALKANLAGYWSRRINDEHRLVYTVNDNDLIIVACRYHYDAI